MWRSLRSIPRIAQKTQSGAIRQFSNGSYRAKYFSYLPIAIGGGVVGGYFAISQLHDHTNGFHQVAICDSPGIQKPEFLQPKTSVKPFPKDLIADGKPYTILGLGVRHVSILSFHVYAMGIYIAETDKPLAKAILKEYGADPEDIEQALLDEDRGSEAVSKLLNGGIRFLIRIVPCRNTDFGHLRDGFVRAITGQTRFKTEGNTDNVGKGIGELKVTFGRKKSVKKDQILHLLRDENGVLEFQWYKNTADFVDDTAGDVLGKINEPLVTELLFSQYLSGKNVSCEVARQEAVKSLSNL